MTWKQDSKNISKQEEEKSKNIAVAEEKKQIEYAAAEETITTAQQVIETREHDKSAAAEANDKLDDDDKIKPTPMASKGPEGEIPCCCSIPSSRGTGENKGRANKGTSNCGWLG